MSTQNPVTIVGRWFVKPGNEEAARAALVQLAADVLAHEPDTLAYLVHTASHDASLQSLPPGDPRTITFYESYRDAAAFHAHISGPIFTTFMKQHGALFVQFDNGLFFTADFVHTLAGRVRPAGA